ncbi:hypothetical protein U0070_022549, partial [Myodes glareolus]
GGSQPKGQAGQREESSKDCNKTSQALEREDLVLKSPAVTEFLQDVRMVATHIIMTLWQVHLVYSKRRKSINASQVFILLPRLSDWRASAQTRE